MDHPNGATMEATSARLLHYDAGKLIAEICLSFTEEKASKKKKKKEKKRGKKTDKWKPTFLLQTHTEEREKWNNPHE